MTRLIAAFALVFCPCTALAQAQMVRAAGMPLNDGSLPPGSLTVRLVQGSFAGDLTGIAIELDINGTDTRRAQTGDKGRAEFVHLPIGARVRAQATVNGERLESEPFQVPADTGVRLLLMAGVEGTTPAAPHPVNVAPSLRRSPGAGTVQIAVVSLTILSFVVVGVQQSRRRRRQSRRTVEGRAGD